MVDLPQISVARQLRRNATDAERRLWQLVRNRQLEGRKFRRQASIGPYIVDFVCFDLKLTVEVDGGHHLEQREEDSNRTDWLETQGFRVIRYWNNEVMTNIEGVMASISEAIEHPHLNPHTRKLAPSPSEGEGWDEGATSDPKKSGAIN